MPSALPSVIFPSSPLNSKPAVPPSFLLSTNMSSNLQPILDALDDYAKQTGIDLSNNPFGDKLRSCESSGAILELLEGQAKAFKDYRDGNRKLIDWLSPVVEVIHKFSGILDEASILVSPRAKFVSHNCFERFLEVPFPPAHAILVGIDVLFTVRLLLSATVLM